MNLEIEEISCMAKEQRAIDLAMGTWEEGVLAGAPKEFPGGRELANYGPSHGIEEFLEAVASSNGCDPSEVLPTPGATTGLGVVLMALRQPRVVVGNPTYPGFLHTSKQLGCDVVSLSPSRPGKKFGSVDWEAVQETLLPGDLLVMADPDNPTGRVFEMEDYEVAQEICKQVDAWFFIDRTYDEFAIDRPSAKLCDAMGDRLIFGGSVSKTLGASLRIGWIVSRNQELLRDSERTIRSLLVSVCPVMQLLVASHLREDRSSLQHLVRENHDHAFRILSEFGLTPRRSEGGLFICAHVDDPWSAFHALRDRGVMSVPSDVFQAAGETRGGFLRLCLARKANTIFQVEENLLGD
ncbi:MAG: pyridoxal phosphate-dependent aminotransferase [Pseudomonadales bacterium]|nr:pyridoxal phosphate-dependent aminotransferase [Pseudomonadales bacterium]